MFNLPESVVNNNSLKILTPHGYESFFGINKITKDSYIFLKFSNGKEIKCSENHPFLTIDGFKLAKDLDKKTEIESIDGGCFVVSKRTIKKPIELYDIIDSGKDKIYYSNGIVSHNCSFLGSTNTLVSGEKLASLAYQSQVGKYSDMIIYEQPIKDTIDDDTGEPLTKDHLYAITVDVSEGKNLDYSAFSVFDISTMPYRQVATYRNNTIAPMIFPSIIKACAEYYNNAYVLIEINMNPQIADILCDDLDYENLLRVFTGNKKPQTLSMRGGRGIAQGLKMSPLVKRIGCSTLKTLIENDKLIISDFETISEMTTFVQEGPSYKAEEGCNDDLAMSLVIFGWLATQKLFKEIVEHDLRKQLQIENFDFIEDEMLPVLGPTTGLETKHFIEDGAVWVETSSSDPYRQIFNELFRDGNDIKGEQNEFF